MNHRTWAQAGLVFIIAALAALVARYIWPDEAWKKSAQLMLTQFAFISMSMAWMKAARGHADSA